MIEEMIRRGDTQGMRTKNIWLSFLGVKSVRRSVSLERYVCSIDSLHFHVRDESLHLLSQFTTRF